MRLACLIVALGVAFGAGPAAAQNVGGPLQQGVVQSPVLVVEIDRLFSQSIFGQKVAAEIEAEGGRIAMENRQIETELIEEEQRLTQQRAELEPDQFRPLADAFDAKVENLRREQDAKARALGARTDESRRAFLNAVQPILQEIMRESGAAVLLDRRAVFLSDEAVDVTDLAIARIDAAIGDAAEGSVGSPDSAPAPGDGNDP